MRRFFQDRGLWWTNARRTTARKWFLVIMTGVIIGAIGYFVYYVTNVLVEFKFNISNNLIYDNNWGSAFFAFTGINILYSIVAGGLCWIEPVAAGILYNSLIVITLSDNCYMVM